MSPDLIDGRYRPIFFYYGSLSTVFFSECNPIDRRYRPYHSVSVSNPIDCWYQPYSVVSVILSTVDIDRDQSTGRLKSHQPIDDTCGYLKQFGPRVTNQSAKDVKATTFFERLYLVPDCAKLRPLSPYPWRPLPHLSFCNYFSISVQFFCQHDSPSSS